jgi:hypothetical protein
MADCQTLSGSAFRWVVPNNEGSFGALFGTPQPSFGPQSGRAER